MVPKQNVRNFRKLGMLHQALPAMKQEPLSRISVLEEKKRVAEKCKPASRATANRTSEHFQDGLSTIKALKEKMVVTKARLVTLEKHLVQDRNIDSPEVFDRVHKVEAREVALVPEVTALKAAVEKSSACVSAGIVKSICEVHSKLVSSPRIFKKLLSKPIEMFAILLELQSGDFGVSCRSYSKKRFHACSCL